MRIYTISTLIILLVVGFIPVSNGQSSNELISHLKQWMNAEEHSIMTVVRIEEKQLEELNSKLKALQEKDAIFDLCSSCSDNQNRDFKTEMEDVLQRKQQVVHKLESSLAKLESLADPSTYFSSDSYQNIAKSWEVFGLDKPIADSRSLLLVIEGANELSERLSPYLPNSGEIKNISALMSWLQTAPVDMPSFELENAQKILEEINGNLSALPNSSKKLLDTWDLDKIQELDVEALQQKAENALIKSVERKALAPIGIASSEGVTEAVYKLEEKLPVKDRLFTETDLLSVKGQGIAALSSLFGMKISDRISVGAGATLATKKLGYDGQKIQPDARFLTRYNLLDGIGSIDLEQVIPTEGFDFDKIEAYQRLGTRLRIPTGEDNPLVISIMRTLKSNKGDSFRQSLWQFGMGMSF